MKQHLLRLFAIFAIAAGVGIPTLSAQISFSGNALPPVTDTPDAVTGLKAVYTLQSTAGVTVNYTAGGASAAGVKWQKYSNLGGGYAQDVPSTFSGNVSSVALTGDDAGYIIDDGGTRTCIWVVNYANHPCRLESLSVSPEQDCLSASLIFTGSADKITYYTVNGVPRTLSRDLILKYNTLAFNAESNSYEQTPQQQHEDFITGEIHIPAPLCSTDFTLSGDRFLNAWGRGVSVTSSTYTARAVEAVTSAVQEKRDNDNEQKTDGDGSALGGSAPVTVSFEAQITDAAIYHEWQFAFDPSFDIIDMRNSELSVTRTFNEYGTVYARFICGDDSGECTWTSETYTIAVGESRLECPNAFSPGSSEGVNDEWKVSYKSIVKFDCHIFNRWGQEMAHLTDPSQGWDGRYGGKLVKSGVFFYVIQAEGADGKKYKLSGDINVLHMKRENNLPQN